jgi:hypothetical protein
MQDTPVVDDEDIAATPMVGAGRATSQPVFDQRQRSPSAIIDRFETAGIVSQKGMIRRQNGRIKRAPAASHEDRRAFKKVKLGRRKPKRSPVNQHRWRARGSGIDAPEKEIAARSRSMAELRVKRQCAQAVASTQGPWMRVFSRIGSNDLFKCTGTASSPSTEEVCQPADFADDIVVARALDNMLSPAVLGEHGLDVM